MGLFPVSAIVGWNVNDLVGNAIIVGCWDVNDLVGNFVPEASILSTLVNEKSGLFGSGCLRLEEDVADAGDENDFE